LKNQHLTGRADVHMHTCASDGLPNAKQVLDYVAKRGHLDVIAITDHDVLEASLWAYSQRNLYPFDIIPGVEVTAHEGHVLALWVTQPIPTKMSIPETVEAIHEQHGIAILAHPGEILINGRNVFRYLRDPAVLVEWEFDGVEVFNAGTMTPGNNLLAQRITHQLALPLVGNSDAHTLNAIGRGMTRFRGRTAADFRAALGNGDVAVEGARWLLTDYLRLSVNLIPGRQNVYTGMSSLWIHPASRGG
jgi:predicted metal-dependent phosphoesterase TrpH